MNIDLTKIPDDFFDKREVTFLHDINERFKQSVKIVREKTNNSDKLQACFDFLTFGLLNESVKSEFNSISRTWFFPSSEAEMELDNAINHCLIASYKASYDHLRRGLELVLTNIYLTHPETPEKKARLWMKSKGTTPFFSREVIANIIKYERFKDVDQENNWSGEIKDFYFKICDIVHVNGPEKGFQKLNKTNFFLSGTTLVNINEETIIQFFNDFIKTMEYISLSLVLYNPILLVDLPIIEKFGLNFPMSGFFDWANSEIINKLIPYKYKTYCENLKRNDEEIISVKSYIESMPSLTKEQIDQQIKDQQDFFDKYKPNNR